VSGWNRNASVLSSEFKWLGMSAVALMGYTDEEDGTRGEQPWGTVISGCAFSELGLLEKQSSALFLGKSPLARFEGNLAFNGPRAMINFNDGFGGGHNVSSNAMWNTCRETGDHGRESVRHRRDRTPACAYARTHAPRTPHTISHTPARHWPPSPSPAMNSWQRQPFSSMISTGGASATFASALSATHNNAINAGYGGSQAFDNDDG